MRKGSTGPRTSAPRVRSGDDGDGRVHNPSCRRVAAAGEVLHAAGAREHAARSSFRLRETLHLTQALEDALGGGRLRSVDLHRPDRDAEKREAAAAAVAIDTVE